MWLSHSLICVYHTILESLGGVPWWWFMILLMWYWIQFAMILLRIFESVFIREIDLKCWYFGRLMSKVVFLLIGFVVQNPSEIGLFYMGRFWIRTFYLRRFLIIVSVYLLVISLFRFSPSSSLSFGRLQGSQNLSISSRFSCLTV